MNLLLFISFIILYHDTACLAEVKEINLLEPIINIKNIRTIDGMDEFPAWVIESNTTLPPEPMSSFQYSSITVPFALKIIFKASSRNGILFSISKKRSKKRKLELKYYQTGPNKTNFEFILENDKNVEFTHSLVTNIWTDILFYFEKEKVSMMDSSETKKLLEFNDVDTGESELYLGNNYLNETKYVFKGALQEIKLYVDAPFEDIENLREKGRKNNNNFDDVPPFILPPPPLEKFEKGDKGDPGEPGPEGQQGIKGDKGDVGALGNKGDKGPIGEPGIDGVPGSKGNSGPPGPPGKDCEAKSNIDVKTQKGDTGSPGLQGPQGPKGDIGEKGIIGHHGSKGEKGDDCKFSEEMVSQILKTMPELRGPQGPRGNDGKPGLPGENCKVGSGPSELQIPKGEKGDKVIEENGGYKESQVLLQSYHLY